MEGNPEARRIHYFLPATAIRASNRSKFHFGTTINFLDNVPEEVYSWSWVRRCFCAWRILVSAHRPATSTRPTPLQQTPAPHSANHRFVTLFFSQRSESLFPQFPCFHNHLRCRGWHPKSIFSRHSSLAIVLSPLFLALPYVFVLTPLSTAFTHFDPGGRVTPFLLCDPRRTQRLCVILLPPQRQPSASTCREPPMYNLRLVPREAS
jgi:hypothetical protein